MATVVDALGAAAALMVAVAAAWAQRVIPPEVEEERWFKLVLATLLLGRTEAAGGDPEQWRADVLRLVLYHPAGREPERKVAHPEAWRLPTESLPGERALVTAMAALPDAASRWALLYDTDPAGVSARLEDPMSLGTDWEPQRWLGQGIDWPELARWGAGTSNEPRLVLERQPLHFGLLRSGEASAASALLGALAAEIPGSQVWDLGEGDQEACAEALRARWMKTELPTGQRWVWVADGAAAHVLLRVLAGKSAEGLRDCSAAVVSLGGHLHTEAVRDWMGHWYAHVHLDTDARRLTPYLSVSWLDREAVVPGDGTVALAEARFGRPVDDQNAVHAVDPVDLGVLPADEALPLELVARALWTVIALSVRVRGL